jgi:acyl-CoA reductase-like NAD-dependent aldehyde dehydrogenase
VSATAQREYGLFVDGESAEGSESRQLIEPATGEPLATIQLAGEAEIDRAVTAARAALDGAWGKTPATERSRLLHALADAIVANRKELAELETRNVGKAISSVKLELNQAVENFRFYASAIATIAGRSNPIGGSLLFYSLKEPVGVAAQIVPWNYPLTMATWKLAPALAAGCSVVLKPDPQTPLTALRLAELAAEVGFPAGVINIVPGDGPTTGAYLVSHPGVDKVAFTGSTAVGREIGAKCGRSLKRVTLELGGKSPNIILPDADLEAAVKGSFLGLYSNSGQACNAASRLFVQAGLFDDVVERLAQFAREAKVGPGLEPDSQFGPVVSAEQFGRVTGYIDSGLTEGAEAVAGGLPEGNGDGGYFIEPTLFTRVSDEMRIAREEIFGPVLVAQPFEDLEEVARRANDTEYGLAAGLWTRDVSNAHKLAAMLKAGSVYINTWGAGDPAAPFGGYKNSGIGREKGNANLEAYLETKSVFVQL